MMLADLRHTIREVRRLSEPSTPLVVLAADEVMAQQIRDEVARWNLHEPIPVITCIWLTPGTWVIGDANRLLPNRRKA